MCDFHMLNMRLLAKCVTLQILVRFPQGATFTVSCATPIIFPDRIRFIHFTSVELSLAHLLFSKGGDYIFSLFNLYAKIPSAFRSQMVFLIDIYSFASPTYCFNVSSSEL